MKSEAGEAVTLEKLPATLGPYEIRGVIGAGGMGIVYQGWDARLNRSVAVKTLKGELAKEPAFCERFLREARAVASLSHPNVTQIYYIGEDQGRPFFAMEFLEGKSLDALLREEARIPPARAADLIRQAAAGLKAAAARGVIHRDIKPSNLVLTREGAVKVTDFGLAKMVVADSGLTLTGEVLGSPNYLAPEQASGAPADLRSDIYSLGATLYELLTGRPPYDGPTPVSIILKHIREPLRSPRQFRSDLPLPLVTLTQRMLAKRPEDRPRDYDALLRELDRLLAPIGTTARTSGPGAPPPAQAAPRSVAPSSGLGAPWILIPIVALALIALWGFLRQSRAGAASSAPSLEVHASSGIGASLDGTKESGGSGEGAGEAGPHPRSPTFEGETTRVLSTTAEVAPSQSGAGGGRARAFEVQPRLDRLRVATRANLQFVENTHEITLDGRLRVKGSVYNSGLSPAGDIKVRIVLTDAAGGIVASTEASLSPPFLSAQQAGTFEVYFPDPHRSISIKAELSWNS
ncbi:MAG TPA: serine/threonine-protein kinase [Candidatus Polarisedimenticolia bacterium]|nr:serine/threonine-protein kinase [Candidatus Polarisedimenticolia bacterium]